MNNAIAIESFIEYCDDMMIVNESFDVKSAATNLKTKFVTFLKRAADFFRRVIRIDISKKGKCDSELRLCDKTLNDLMVIDKADESKAKSILDNARRVCERLRSEIEKLKAEMARKKEALKK